jgi:hypothetical protein
MLPSFHQPHHAASFAGGRDVRERAPADVPCMLLSFHTAPRSASFAWTMIQHGRQQAFYAGFYSSMHLKLAARTESVGVMLLGDDGPRQIVE